MLVFLLDFCAERYVENKYHLNHTETVETIITDQPGEGAGAGAADRDRALSLTHNQMHSGDQDENLHAAIAAQGQGSSGNAATEAKKRDPDLETASKNSELATETGFRQQIAAFLILEFGVIFHSVIIGLNLGSAGSEFSTLYPVLVFHQSFEGLGIGARMSAIPFPKRYFWLPWALCAVYGLTTPIAIAAGLGVRTTYTAGSYTASVVSGVLDSISAGILIYTGLVELLARDFLFNPELTRDTKRIIFMVVCLFLGTALMALLGKWA
jgi:zinc transporter 1/2/3